MHRSDFGHIAIGVPRNRAIPANGDPRFIDLGLCGPARTDIVLAFITSRAGVTGQDSLPLQPSPENGLKVPSAVRFDKLATIEKSLVAGRIGKADTQFLASAGPVFFRVFGFDRP